MPDFSLGLIPHRFPVIGSEDILPGNQKRVTEGGKGGGGGSVTGWGGSVCNLPSRLWALHTPFKSSIDHLIDVAPLSI